MKIAIDINAPVGNAAGLEVWVQGFISGLSLVDKENEYLIFCFFMRNFENRAKKICIPQEKNFHLYIKRFPRPLLVFFEDHNISIIEKWLTKHNVDVFHGTGYFLPYLKKIKGVVTVHGLDFAEMDTYWYQDKWYKNVPNYLKRADIIIAVSEYVKSSIIKHYNINQEKIKVVYPDIRKEFKKLENINEKLYENFKISDPFILTVATSIERKNLRRILEAFAILKKNYNELKLVIAGGLDIKEKLLNAIEKHKLQDSVNFKGYLNSEMLSYLYNKAELFVFPSLYEGFGLPVLEAMACGCPVITSNVSALPEIAGDAAVFVNPYSIEEIAQTMEKVLTDTELREQLKNSGLKRVKIFSWVKGAKEVVEIYKTLKSAI